MVQAAIVKGKEFLLYRIPLDPSTSHEKIRTKAGPHRLEIC